MNPSLKANIKSALKSLSIDPNNLREFLMKARVLGLRYSNHQLENFVKKEVKKLQSDLGFPPTPSPRYNVGVVWEADGTFFWLEQAKKTSKTMAEIIYLPRSLFNDAWKMIMKGYTTGAQLGEAPLDRYYRSEFSSQREVFRSYCKRVIKALKKLYQIDVFVLPKFNDDWITDLIRTLKESNEKVVINDREVLSTVARMKVYPPIIRKHLDFEVDALCVASDHHKEFFTKSNYPPSKITVTGKLNSDYWFRSDLWRDRAEINSLLDPKRSLILYFSFGPKTYLNFFYGDEIRDWASLAKDYHEILLDTVKSYPDKIQIAYKSGGKPHRDYFEGFDRFAREIKEFGQKDTLVPLDSRYSSLDLARSSDIIIGFMTSGLIEAMFTQNPILSGGWGSLYDDIGKTLVPYEESGALYFCRSKEQMKDLLRTCITTKENLVDPDMKMRRKKFIEKYFSKADGRVGARLLAEIDRVHRRN